LLVSCKPQVVIVAAVSHAPGAPGVRGRVSAAVAVAAGKMTGRVLSVLPTVPGLTGAAMASVCAGEVTGHVFGHGLAPWVAGLAGSVFLLILDRRL
jgi:hypothetical protein